MGEPGDEQENQLESADEQGDALDRSVAAGEGDRQQHETTRVRLTGDGTPISAPTLAMPENSLSSAPMQETIRVPVENQAQNRP